MAKTVLSFMICCMFGGKKILYKALLVFRLDAEFQCQQTLLILNGIRNSGGTVIAILCDNNRVNQNFFKRFDCVTPWRTRDNIFLLFDYVHLLKSIRNNWLTEKSQEFIFVDNGEQKIAKWGTLKKLHSLESGALVKLSKLNEQSVAPKPIERQKVSICLNVFCEQTLVAVKTHSGLDDVNGPVSFMEKIISFFKIMNVQSMYDDVRTSDPSRSTIPSLDDEKLKLLTDLADMAEAMMPAKQGGRVRQLTKDTSRALSHTCRGMVDLVAYLLETSHDYVCLGHFSSDPIEKVFGKLRQGSGGVYFINVQQVLQKVTI